MIISMHLKNSFAQQFVHRKMILKCKVLGSTKESVHYDLDAEFPYLSMFCVCTYRLRNKSIP